MTHPDPNAWLMSGAVPAAKFETIGTSVVGTVKDTPTVRPQTDMTTGDVLRWPSGAEKEQMIIILQTSERDPTITDDDGARTLYVKGYMVNALRDAVRASGAKGIEIGGRLTMAYVSDGEQTVKGFSKPKMYSANYIPPNVVKSNDFVTKPNVADPRLTYGSDSTPPTKPAGTGGWIDSPPVNAGNGAASSNGAEPWRLTPEMRAALIGIGGDPEALEGRRKAAYDLGIDPNMVKVNA